MLKMFFEWEITRSEMRQVKEAIIMKARLAEMLKAIP